MSHTHSVRVGLYGQGCVDRQDLEEEGQLALEGVFDLGAQAGREVGDPLAQRGLCNPVVFNLGITFGVSTHPQLQETAEIISALFNVGTLSTLRTVHQSPGLTGKTRRTSSWLNS